MGVSLLQIYIDARMHTSTCIHTYVHTHALCRKHCTITSFSTLSSQLHNTSTLSISSFITWGPTWHLTELNKVVAPSKNPRASPHVRPCGVSLGYRRSRVYRTSRALRVLFLRCTPHSSRDVSVHIRTTWSALAQSVMRPSCRLTLADFFPARFNLPDFPEYGLRTPAGRQPCASGLELFW